MWRQTHTHAHKCTNRKLTLEILISTNLLQVPRDIHDFQGFLYYNFNMFLQKAIKCITNFMNIIFSISKLLKSLVPERYAVITLNSILDTVNIF